MLVACGPDGRPVIAEKATLEQLQRWSHERTLYCPNCHGIVHVRGGPEKRMQLHFAHQKGECAWSTEAESVRHSTGKLVLSAWLREQFPGSRITLEERLPEPNRIADIFVRHMNSRQWAIEFQCAPLEGEQWHHRHNAYRDAGIHDIWIIGNNRREKQEAFIEAIFASAHEVLFLDSLVSPPRIWLRWSVPRDIIREWQLFSAFSSVMSLDSWVGRTGYGAMLTGRLQDISLSAKGTFQHLHRMQLEQHIRFTQKMTQASIIDENLLIQYMRQFIDEQTLSDVIIPLLHSYLLDPDLLRRYNYGRGIPGLPLSTDDRQRISKASAWRNRLIQQGYTVSSLKELPAMLPYTGPYAAFARYIEMFLTLP